MRREPDTVRSEVVNPPMRGEMLVVNVVVRFSRVPVSLQAVEDRSSQSLPWPRSETMTGKGAPQQLGVRGMRPSYLGMVGCFILTRHRSAVSMNRGEKGQKVGKGGVDGGRSGGRSGTLLPPRQANASEGRWCSYHSAMLG